MEGTWVFDGPILLKRKGASEEKRLKGAIGKWGRFIGGQKGSPRKKI